MGNAVPGTFGVGAGNQSHGWSAVLQSREYSGGLLLLLLTGVGPLLAWRKTSMESLKRNFRIPVLTGLAVGVLLVAIGYVKPWTEQSEFYSLMTIVLSVFVATTVISEFVRGGRVIGRHTGQNLFASMVQLTRRNTRRYGGYIVHFGVIVIMIGFAGSAFNQDIERELTPGQSMAIGPYTLTCVLIRRTITRITAASGPSSM